MSPTFEFLDERANAAEIAAAGAQLANVRERELRSAKVWRQLADRALASQATRAIDQNRIKQRSEGELVI